VNGGRAGALKMRDWEAAAFQQIMANGCVGNVDKLEATGSWGAPDEPREPNDSVADVEQEGY
jgi:hypothetical protein